MQKDMHFACFLALLKAAGWSDEDALLSAWANQATDVYAQVGWNFLWSKLGRDCHFVPGDDPDNPLVCTANSKLVQLIWDRADTRIQKGLAGHAFQDSWSHDGFIGACSRVNSPPKWDKPGWWPHYGHCGYLRAPDNAVAEWMDTRRNRPVRNHCYFQYCIEAMGRRLGIEDEVHDDIYAGLEIANYDKRKAYWLKLAGFPGLSWTTLNKTMWPKHKEEFKYAMARQKNIVQTWLKGRM